MCFRASKSLPSNRHQFVVDEFERREFIIGCVVIGNTCGPEKHDFDPVRAIQQGLRAFSVFLRDIFLGVFEDLENMLLSVAEMDLIDYGFKLGDASFYRNGRTA